MLTLYLYLTGKPPNIKLTKSMALPYHAPGYRLMRPTQIHFYIRGSGGINVGEALVAQATNPSVRREKEIQVTLIGKRYDGMARL